jgi:hypothetical protein
MGDEAPQTEGVEAETHDNAKKWRTETMTGPRRITGQLTPV